jgi:signal transduction histidine kinase
MVYYAAIARLMPADSQKAKHFPQSFEVLLFFIITFGILFSFYAFLYVDRVTKRSMQERIGTIAAVLDVRHIKALSGTAEDANNLAYHELKAALAAVVKVNADTRFAYLAGQRGGDIFFFVDSEPEDSPDMSPPGQIYSEVGAEFRAVFETKMGAVEGPVTDRWGSWISAFAPIIDPDTGELLAVAGFDVDTGNYYRWVAVSSVIPILLTVLLVGITLFLYRLHRKDDFILDIRSELASIAAHDLRSPLTGMTWSLDAMLGSPSSKRFTKHQLEILHNIRATGYALQQSVANILDLSQVFNRGGDVVTLQSWNIRALLDDTVSLFVLAAKEKSLTIAYDAVFPAAVFTVCDGMKIKRVFSNLIANAVKYATPGTVIAIGYRETPMTHIVSVANDGHGIPASEQGRLFNKYYRTKEAARIAPGTGLGLYYVKKIIDLHHGRVWVESKEGVRCTFFVELPKNAAAA